MQIFRIVAPIVLLIATTSTALACEASTAPLYQSLEGDWRSDGNAFGQPAASQMRWAPVMDNCFWQVDYEIETNPGTDNANIFMGRGVHLSADGTVSGSWIDNQAVLHRLRGTITDTELLVYWGEPSETLGRSRYRALEDGNIQVTDWILRDDGWRQFNDNVFERTDD